MINRPALVIFDCDGVLVDSEPIAMRVLVEVIADAGLKLDETTAHRRFLGRSLSNIREILAQDFGIRLDEAALAGMRNRLYRAFRAELKPVAGIVATLDGIGAPFCVASSSQVERVEVSLQITGLLPKFTGNIFSSSMVPRGKPAPDLFLHAAAAMGFAPADCLVVEDSPPGIEAAHAGGMQVVAFVGGGHARGAEHRAAIAAMAPDGTIEDMHDLIAILGNAI